VQELEILVTQGGNDLQAVQRELEAVRIELQGERLKAETLRRENGRLLKSLQSLGVEKMAPETAKPAVSEETHRLNHRYVSAEQSTHELESQLAATLSGDGEKASEEGLQRILDAKNREVEDAITKTEEMWRRKVSWSRATCERKRLIGAQLEILDRALQQSRMKEKEAQAQVSRDRHELIESKGTKTAFLRKAGQTSLQRLTVRLIAKTDPRAQEQGRGIRGGTSAADQAERAPEGTLFNAGGASGPTVLSGEDGRCDDS
jgi:hypothetical protein